MLSHEERTRRSRRTIVDAALRIIGEEGYRAMTTTRIEEVAGVSRGLVGYHFGSKRGLTEAVIGRVRDLFTEGVIAPQAVHRDTGPEGALGLIRGYFGGLREDPRPNRAMLILIVESFADQPELRDAVRELNAALRDQLLRGQRDGSVWGELDPGVESVVLVGILRGITVQWLADPDAVDLGRAAERAVAIAARTYDAGRRPTA